MALESGNVPEKVDEMMLKKRKVWPVTIGYNKTMSNVHMKADK